MQAINSFTANALICSVVLRVADVLLLTSTCCSVRRVPLPNTTSVCEVYEQCQTAKSAAEAATSPDFLHLLQQAPRLMQAILCCSATMSCLSATSKAMQDLVRSSVTRITIGGPHSLPNLQKLVEGGYRHLQSLALHRVPLDSVAISTLTQACWPQLRRLSLTSSGLDNNSAMLLTQGNWPLKDLDLSWNPLGPASLRWLVKAQWQLKSLCLIDVKLEATNVKELVRAKWPGLKRLYLSKNKLTSMALVPLLKAQWKELRHVNLSHNLLTWQAVATLTQVAMPHLIRLDLSHNLLSQRALPILESGNWPQLERLDLCYCGMYSIEDVIGNWPKLSSLRLSGNMIEDGLISNVLVRWPMMCSLWLEGTMLSTIGVQQLVQGQWPKLYMLLLAENQLGQEAKRLLSVACQRDLPTVDSTRWHVCHVEDGKGPWPKLRYISV